MKVLNSELAHIGIRLIDAKEYQRAFDLFIQYPDEPLAQFHIGEIYFNDDSEDDHLDQAFEWYKKSALGGYKHALFQLAYCYEFGIGTDEDVKQAKHWYLKFAEEDEPVGLHRLGGIYARGVDGKTDQVQAYRWFYLSYIMTGNVRYLENLKDSMVMMTAREQEKALSLAEDWIEGRYKVQTQGLRRDIEKLVMSIDEFDLFLKKGLDCLTHQLVLTGLRLVKQREFEQAKALFMHHSKEPLGQYFLGYVFSQETKSVNLSKAFEWFLKSAKGGCSLAFFNVGLCYSEGLGVPLSANEAVKWYRKGAELGDSYAQFNLSQMLARRVEVARDFNEAYKWFFISKFLGNDSSERWVIDMINKLSKEEYDDINFEIEEWVSNKFEISSDLDHPDFRRLARSENKE
jgi:TPR repeat protein